MSLAGNSPLTRFVGCPLCPRTVSTDVSAVTRPLPQLSDGLPNALFAGFCNWHGACCVLQARMDDKLTLGDAMNTLSSKLTTFAAALAMNSLIMGALGFLFELQSHPHLSVISFARS